MGPAWFIVQMLIFSSDGLSGIVVWLTTTTATTLSKGSTILFINKSKVVKSAAFAVTASGFWISAGTPFVPIFWALPADKREQGGAHLRLAFTGYNGTIPKSPVPSWSHLVSAQIFSRQTLSKEILLDVNCPQPDADCHTATPTSGLLDSSEYYCSQHVSFEPKKGGF